MLRRTIVDLQYSLLNAGSVVPIPGAPRIPFTIVGTHNDESIAGTRGHDIIGGLGGKDVIAAGAGNDWLLGGRSNDHLDGGTGDDHILGDEGDDYVWGDAGNDVIHGGIGDDYGSGWDGDDAIHGDAGNDLIGGSDGNDLLDGGDGNDDLEGGIGEDTLYGGAGNDILDDHKEPDGSGGTDWFYGGDGDDQLFAAGVEDALAMNAIDGGAGFDRLELVPEGNLISNLGLLAGQTKGVEAIGLSHCIETTLIVNPQDVLDFSGESNTLYITGGHDSVFWLLSCQVDSAGSWAVGGIVQAFNNEFQHYQASVNGQQVDLYVDTWLSQIGVVL
jgi:Ca2+-binding RTX toxin-like protein